METEDLTSILEYIENEGVGQQILTFENGVVCVRSKISTGFSAWKTKNSILADNTPINLNKAYEVNLNPFAKYKDFSATGATVKIFNNIPYIVKTNQMINYPCFTIIDDDTSNLKLVQLFHTLCTNKGILGNYGVLTGRNNTELYNTLLEYEAEGHGMLFHGLTQNSAYLRERSPEATADFVNGYRKFKEIGFTDNKIWVTPYGTGKKSILELAPMFGFVAAFSTGTSAQLLVCVYNTRQCMGGQNRRNDKPV